MSFHKLQINLFLSGVCFGGFLIDIKYEGFQLDNSLMLACAAFNLWLFCRQANS